MGTFNTTLASLRPETWRSDDIQEEFTRVEVGRVFVSGARLFRSHYGVNQ